MSGMTFRSTWTFFCEALKEAASWVMAATSGASPLWYQTLTSVVPEGSLPSQPFADELLVVPDEHPVSTESPITAVATRAVVDIFIDVPFLIEWNVSLAVPAVWATPHSFAAVRGGAPEVLIGGG